MHEVQFDCSPAELAERVERRAADRKRIDGEKRMRRDLDRHIWRRKEFEDQRLARGERRQATQIAMRDAAQAEWLAFNGTATAEQIETFKTKYRRLMIPWTVKPVSIAPSPQPESTMPANLSIVPAEPTPDLLKASGEFVRGLVPPDYVVDGILQRRFFYSITAQTGVGKTTVAMLLSALVATGRRLGNLEVAKGTVLYFAGENPTDIQMRWLGLTQEMGIDPATADVHFVPGAMPLSSVAERITTEVYAKGLRLALVIVDTAAAYFEGDNENDNAQAVEHARRIRSLTELPGGPCVLVLAHPTKRAGEDDLIPRGGGAFLAEVDGNIALQKRESLVVASVQGKFRGREFTPISFELKTVLHPLLKDAKGRDIPTVVARPIDETGKAHMAAANRRAEDELLKAIYEQPGASLRTLAASLRWLDSKQQPNAMKVSRACDVLAREKLVRKHRGTWQLTSAGEIELNKLDRPTSDLTYPLTPTVTTPATSMLQPPPIPTR